MAANAKLQALLDLLENKYNLLNSVQAEFRDFLTAEFTGDKLMEKMSIIREKGDLKGKSQVLERRVVLDEWLQLGDKSEAATAIFAAFPRLKELKDSEKSLIDEIKQIETDHFGFHHKEFTLRNLLKMMIFVMDNLENNEKAQ